MSGISHRTEFVTSRMLADESAIQLQGRDRAYLDLQRTKLLEIKLEVVFMRKVGGAFTEGCVVRVCVLVLPVCHEVAVDGVVQCIEISDC